ncbi:MULTISPECIES: pyrimidine/purine nucleoside phosphorylase [unclassified Marinobacter]|uniref:pyrimidine/purine nucleoside phosphorylase n=1 Tax=unclassified Marinobacter TaxID=83889 RepID=UPI0000F36B0C|nr:MULTISPECIES: pyrimidine/purine nucleoside phosphorylase [unclassified Marinobacter]EAZ99211.1 hypothetical protein MELB17_06534 [Marinobacter sp. ELB17]PFG09628.1 hypothetical protein ATI45_2012 [Marinobacter sp. LV10MA510-1]PFG51552.1 hypothetical protein ATG98_0504 [Marinobacter sp. LV10R520-4]
MLKVNEYFDGKAKSIAFQSDALPATIGVISPGEYQFSTQQKETMTIVSGVMSVCLPGVETWMTYGAGECFGVAPDSTFRVTVEYDTAYLCTYG